MTKIFRHILAGMMTASLLTACDRKEAEPKADVCHPTFSATIEGTVSRAFDTTWETDDLIGITVAGGSVSGGNVSSGGATNLSFSHQGNGTFAVTDPTKQIIFDNDDKVTFVAYYPYNTKRTSAGKISSINTLDQRTQSTFDYLWAKGEGSKSEPNVHLEFEHKMCKLTFVLKSDSDSDLESISSFKFTGVKFTAGTFDTTTGICSASTSSGTTTVTPPNIEIENGEGVISLIIIPQTVYTVPVPFQIIDKSGYAYCCELPLNSPTIEAGKHYRFVINLNKLAPTVTAHPITDWLTKDQGDDWEAN